MAHEFVVPIDEDLLTEDVVKFAEVASQCIITYARKNNDYGNSFDKGMDDLGLAYGIGRLYDKMNRVLTLTKVKQAVQDENIGDTLLDMACYSIMLYKYLQNKKQ